MVVSWEVFKDRFLGHYFPENLKHAKEMEFLQLKQGSMSVGEYAAKFQNMSKYSNYYQLHTDERWRCRKFEEGLRWDIKDSVGPLEIQEFSQLVNKCTIIEGYKAEKPGGFKGFGPQFKGKAVVGRGKPYFIRSGGRRASSQTGSIRQSVVSNTRCSKCGKNHDVSVYREKTTVCFICGKPRHFFRDCTQQRNIPLVNNPRAGRGRGRGSWTGGN